MAKNVRWGILGAGGIARKFAGCIPSVQGAALTAVGSRSRDKADAFADEFDIPHRHGSYEDLAADTEVDAIYVATPHPMHKAHALLALGVGKAVLCEKPLTINAAEARELVAFAREKKCFLMEAMWTRFVPPMVKLRELLAEGAIGEVRMLTADFGFDGGPDPTSRLLDPALGGGSLLDVGVYAIALASMLFGTPSRITGLAHLGETGVDEQTGMVLGYEGGELAILSSAVRLATPQEAWVIGTTGRIHLHTAWWSGSGMTLYSGEKEPRGIDVPMKENGFAYEAEEVVRCLAAGKTESDVVPLDESISMMETMDELRAQWGLKYPME